MILRLEIKNIALLESGVLEFGQGLTVLTGETGGGKSVIVTALSLALGARAEKEFIRHGEEKAEVTALFDISTLSKSIKKEFGFGKSDQLELHRTITLSGNSTIKINGVKSTVAQLRLIATEISEILGQHASQTLLNEENHLLFLDSFASLSPVREKVSTLYHKWKSSADELRRVQNRQEQLKAERELLLFQKKEIENAHIAPGEEEQITRELKVLNSSRTLMASASRLEDLMGGEKNSLLDLLSLARKEVEIMAEADESLKAKAEQLIDIEIRTEDLRRFIEQYGGSIQDNPSRIEEINIRLDELYGLKKKYGGSEESILETLGEINNRLKDNPDIDSLIETLQSATLKKLNSYGKQALTLSKERQKFARKLKKAVIAELKDLAIDNADFEFEFVYDETINGVQLGDRTIRPSEFGLETGRILFTANPGEPLQPLVKTASGGELSRLLLALKAAESSSGSCRQPLLVFDEVDVGIGGMTAVEVAKKLKKLSNKHQLLVVTHLHQIARFADHHFAVDKTNNKAGRTLIDVQKLDSKTTKAELKRMVALPQGE